jgi:hypothetical protein
MRSALLGMDDVHDEGVGYLPDAISLDKDL